MKRLTTHLAVVKWGQGMSRYFMRLFMRLVDVIRLNL